MSKQGRVKTPSVFSRAVVERVKKVVAERKLTHERIASLASLERSAVSRFLNGSRTKPEFDSLVQIAIALDLSLNWLVSGDGKHTHVWPEEIRLIMRHIGVRKQVAAKLNVAPLVADAQLEYASIDDIERHGHDVADSLSPERPASKPKPPLSKPKLLPPSSLKDPNGRRQ